jgi:hypothetical protein
MTAVWSHRACLRPIAQFFAGMSRAEVISRDVSRRQAELAPDSAMRRFLTLQSRQEAVHAAIFGSALRVASRRDRCPDRLADALARLGSRLNADLDAGWLAGSLIGLQGVLEAIGAVALSAPSTELATIAARFVPLRHALLAQEQAHHRVGRYWLAQIAAGADRSDDALKCSRLEYAELGEAVLVASIEIFDGFDVEQRIYLDAGRAAIRSALSA